jgi:phosphate transport system protein
MLEFEAGPGEGSTFIGPPSRRSSVGEWKRGAREIHITFTKPSYLKLRNRLMSRHLLRDMERIHREVLSLSSVVEEMIDRATVALCERSDDLANSVIQSDTEVDQMEVSIEEDCLKMLALHQPVAVDLRRIATVLKVNNDLERIADLAVNIAERAKSINRFPQFPIPDDVRVMAHMATRMVRGSMDAFVNLDTQQARSVLRMDGDLDI